VIQAGANEGIKFDFERMPVAPNTLNAHRLVLLASKHGLGRQMALALYRAYFSEARDVTDPLQLEVLGVSVGMEVAPLRALLSGEGHRAAVQDSQLEAQRLGISGVPFFIFDQRFAVSGAQPRAVFERALERAVQTG
jgi:predicted DsbA family dithiol-disulfide isomerase